MLAHAQIADLKACAPQRPHQLVAVVLERLQPRPRSCPHREQPGMEVQRPAVGSQLGAGDAGPGLPERRQGSFLLPVRFECLQALAQGTGRRPRRGQQKRQGADPPALGPGWAAAAVAARLAGGAGAAQNTCTMAISVSLTLPPMPTGVAVTVAVLVRVLLPGRITRLDW